MPLPHAVARFNKRYTNWFIEPLARRFAGFAEVEHVGRQTGRVYATAVRTFAREGHLIVVLTYGTRADWVSNVLAGGGMLTPDGEPARALNRAEVVGRTEAWPALPLMVRAAVRLMGVDTFLRVPSQPD